MTRMYSVKHRGICRDRKCQSAGPGGSYPRCGASDRHVQRAVARPTVGAMTMSCRAATRAKDAAKGLIICGTGHWRLFALGLACWAGPIGHQGRRRYQARAEWLPSQSGMRKGDSGFERARRPLLCVTDAHHCAHSGLSSLHTSPRRRDRASHPAAPRASVAGRRRCWARRSR